MGPPDVETSEVEIDLRVGGACRWVMHHGAATRVLHGRIEALDPPRLLVMTNRWDDERAETLITITLAEAGHGSTRIELVHDRIGPDADPALFEAGWAAALACLDRYLESTLESTKESPT
ncbi:MAG: SRPBCC domain-containing protein [Acidimicrobiales bacterium]